jgi:hypothetical protein
LTVADVAVDHLATSAVCLMNGIISKKIHITLLTIHPVSGLTEIASSLL